MRLTTVILIASLLQVSASTLAQKISLSKSNASLKTVLKEIKAQSGYKFVYRDELLNHAKPVSINVNQVQVEKVLQQIFENQELSYSIDSKIVIIKEKGTSFLDRVVKSFQDISVSGVVLDSAGKALPGASVTVKGTLKAVTTGESGAFFIQNIKENSILVISYVGYETQEVKPVPNALMQIRMVAKAGTLQEVEINAGYYTVKEAERTGSISRITSKEIEKQRVTNILAAMQGQMAGVSITQETGVPGGSFKIEIRGRNSLQRNGVISSGNDPLYIVDGMPFSSKALDNPNLTSIVVGQGGASPLNGINPMDIESIEVLKDADATSIYGSRGANGVVLITTKKGKSGKTELSLSANTGIGEVGQKTKLLNTQQYLEMRNEGLKNDNMTPQFYEYEINGTWDQSRYTDWRKELIGGTAQTKNISAQISGGNTNTQFLMSGTYNKQGTVFPGDFNYDKGSFHFYGSHRADNQRFNATFSTTYVADKNDQPASDLALKIFMPPNSPAIYQDNGELNWENNTWNNPIAPLVNRYVGNRNTLNVGSTLAYKVVSGLEIKTILGFNDDRYVDYKTALSTANNPAYGGTSAANSYIFITNSKQQSWNIEPQLQWHQTIAKGKLEALLGTTFMERSNASAINFGYGFPSNSQITNLSAASTQSLTSNDKAQYRYNAIFGRLNYNWDGKYILNLTARRDGSSRFGPGKQFGNFGAAGVAWLFSKEKRINELISFLSFGKLRASYGVTGNDQTSDYGFLNTYSLASSASNYQGSATFFPTRLYNPDFSWETNKKLDVELDLGFMNDRIFFTSTYFRNRSSSQLVGYQLPATTGFSNIMANLNALVQNKGWEFELRTANLQGKKLKWSTSLNVSFLRNKLISFPGLEGSTYADYYVIGQPTNILKVYHYTGLDSQKGIYTFEDVNSDNKITSAEDRKTLLNLYPKYYGGVTNSLSYKNFELDFMFQFVSQKARSYLAAFNSAPGLSGNQPIEILDRWQKPGDIKEVQRYTGTYGDVYNAYINYTNSDGPITDGSFIRLKNVSLAYTVPGSLLKSANCRIYMQGQNLMTITKYKVLDPEIQVATYLPPLRMITIGLQLNF